MTIHSIRRQAGIAGQFAVTADAKATYAGTAYLSAGDYVRMRTVKP